MEVARRTAVYESRFYDPLLVNGYARQKCKYILEAENKTQVDEILAAPKPHYNGNKFADGPYQVNEEELICWGEASLRAPPSSVAVERMFELMHRVFPEERLKNLI